MTNLIKRDISFIEEYYVQRNLKYYPNFQICATYNVNISIEQIFNALTLLLQRHIQWSLQAFPKDNNNKTSYEFKPIETYKLSDVLEIKSSADISLENLLASLVHTKYDISTDKPLWGLILYDSKTLIFNADHLLGDGTSFLNFQLEFLKALNELSNNVDSSPLKFDEGIDSTIYDYKSSLVNEICPASDSIINYSTSWSYMTKTICKALVPVVYDFYRKIIPKTKFEQLSGDKMAVENSTKYDRADYWLSILNIPSEDVGKLIKISRNHGVKLTSLLCTICLLAILPITKDNDTSITIPTDIRNLIDKTKAEELCSSFSDKFGLFMGAVIFDLPSLNKLKQDDNEIISWEVVKYVQSLLSNGIKSSFEPLSVIKLMSSEKYITDAMKKPKSSDFEISNLGSVKQDLNNKFRIVDMIFNQPLGSGGHSFGCNVLGTDVGGVNLSLTCTKALDEDCEKIYFDGVKDLIGIVLSNN